MKGNVPYFCINCLQPQNPRFFLSELLYIYMVCFFHFSCFALLLMQPLQCCAAADRAGLIRSTHVMMLRAISISILALCLTAVIMLRVINRELLYLLCSQQLWLMRLSENASFLENVCVGYLF